MPMPNVNSNHFDKKTFSLYILIIILKDLTQKNKLGNIIEC